MKNFLQVNVIRYVILHAVSYISASCAFCVLMVVTVVQVYRCILKYYHQIYLVNQCF